MAATPAAHTMQLADVRALADRLRANVERVMVGKRDVVDLAIVTLLSEGHLLVEDVPGTGKTTLARTLAQSIGGSFKRLQCTPDLLPSDVTGVSVFDQRAAEFVFRPGPIFTNVLLADEINRATPRTQSAVLEAMQERQVSADGVTRPLPRPFLVVATQNPVELEGTFPLPEAQLDRFLLRLSVGYPAEADEWAMVTRHSGHGPVEAALEPVLDAHEVVAAAEACAQGVRVHEDLQRYIVALTRATRHAPDVKLGASPRATLALYRAAQTWAAMQGRDFVQPDDVQRLAVPVLAHRLVVSIESRLRERDAAAVVESLVHSVPVPVEKNA